MEQCLSSFCHKFAELEREGVPMVVVTMTAVKGSAPQNIGARMIVGLGGVLYGTVGGGKIEAACLKLAKELFESDQLQTAHSRTWNLQKDIGMTCGGEVSFLFEPYQKDLAWNVTIFGAGHISQSLSRTLLNLNCQLRVIDNREEWLKRLPHHPNLQIIHSERMEEEVYNLPENSFVVLMTMGHSTDVPILAKALNEHNFPYLGVIGSKAKRNRMEEELRKLNIGEEEIKSFICPVGEKLGKNSPNEIAISITAQLLKHRD